MEKNILKSRSIDPEDVEEGLGMPSCVQFCGSQITKEGKGRDAFMYYTLYKLKKNKVVSINDMKWDKKNDPPLSDKDLSRIHKQVHKNNNNKLKQLNLTTAIKKLRFTKM